METAILAGIAMLLIIFGTLFLGFPIALSIGAGSVVAMLIITPRMDLALLTSAQRMFTGVNSFALLAIPFFILAGNIMNNGGIAARLVGCARLIAGKSPGYLAQTNIVSNMLFGAVSGSGVAAAAAMGGILSPLEEAEGYDKNFSAAVNAASAPSGMLIPPSNIMIVYAMTAGAVSIAGLFVAGYIPGLLWGLACMAITWYKAKKLGYVSRVSYSPREALKILWQGVPSLLMIIIVIGGILGGFFTPTEGSAIAVAYSLVLSFIYRSIKVSDLPKILLDTVKITAVVQFMVMVSAIMAFVMARTRLPQFISENLFGFTDNYIIILLIINIIMLIVGCFMDPTPAVLIFTPIFLPIVMQFGMHPIHFGIMLVVNKCIGTITPPVGPILFTACRIGDTKFEGILKPLWPYFFAVAVVLLLVTFVPSITMFLPRLLNLA